MTRKSLLSLSAVLLLCAFISGCATAYPIGGLYTELKLPLDATSNMSKSPKVGTATCKSIFGLVAFGDSSIQTAMKNGGITKIHYVDWQVKNILGIGEYTVVVYGE